MKRLAVLGALVCALVLAACGGGHHKAVPAGAANPVQCPAGQDHSLGQCLPHPAPGLALAPRAAAPVARCVDRSNNDPLYGVSAWRAVRAQGFRCAYFKVIEGTGFVDGTAKRMAADARSAGLEVGGYDFQHVCQVPAAGEAGLFAYYLKVDGLAGPRTLPGMADSEYPFSTPCDTRAWMNSWHATADRALGRKTGTYTGAWWWNPHVGCWWEGAYSWISGYVGSLASVPRPCGLRSIDLWQYTGSGVDRSAWVSSRSYSVFAAIPNPPAPVPTRYFSVEAQIRPAARAKVTLTLSHGHWTTSAGRVRGLAVNAKPLGG